MSYEYFENSLKMAKQQVYTFKSQDEIRSLNKSNINIVTYY